MHAALSPRRAACPHSPRSLGGRHDTVDNSALESIQRGAPKAARPVCGRRARPRPGGDPSPGHGGARRRPGGTTGRRSRHAHVQRASTTPFRTRRSPSTRAQHAPGHLRRRRGRRRRLVLDRPHPRAARRRQRQATSLYTQGRALYMYTHNAEHARLRRRAPGQPGRRRLRLPRADASNKNLYTVTVSGAALAERPAERRQYPSHWSSVHTATGLSVDAAQVHHPQQRRRHAADAHQHRRRADHPHRDRRSPIATTPAARRHRADRHASTPATTSPRCTPRFSGDGFTVERHDLVRDVTLAPGPVHHAQAPARRDRRPSCPTPTADTSATATTTPRRPSAPTCASTTAGGSTTSRTSTSPTRTSRRCPTTGRSSTASTTSTPTSRATTTSSRSRSRASLGYNNAIQLTQPMHMQDLKYFRDPLYSYGNWVSSGETSKCTAFTDNPGSLSWGNTYEQYIAREGWNAYKVHGGDPAISPTSPTTPSATSRASSPSTTRTTTPDRLRRRRADRQRRRRGSRWAQYYGQPLARSAPRPPSGTPARGRGRGVRAARQRRPRPPRWTPSPTTSATAILTMLWDDSPADAAPTLEPQPATRAPGQLRQRASGSADPNPTSYVDHARRDRQRPDRLHGRDLGQPGRDHDLVARSSTSAPAPTTNMFLTVNAGGDRRRASPSPTAGGGGEQQINRGQASCRPTSGATSRSRSRAPPARCTSTAPPSRPTRHDAAARRASATRRNNWIGRSQYGDPVPNGVVDDFQHLRPGADRGRDPALIGRADAGPATSPPTVRRGRRRDRHRLLRQRPRRDRRRRPASSVTAGQGLQAARRLARRARAVEGPAELLARSPRASCPTPTTTSRRCATTPTARVPDHAVLHGQPARQGRGRRRHPGSNNFSNINSTLQAQLYAKALREYPSRVHHAGHVPPADRVAELGAVRQRRQPLPRQQRVLLQLEPGRPRRSAAPGSITTSSAPTTS